MVLPSSSSVMDRTRDLIRRRQYQAASLLLPALASLGPDLPWRAEIESEIALAQQQYDKVMVITRAALAQWPDSANLSATRAKAAIKVGDRVAACIAAADAVVNNPGSNHAKSLLGQTLFALGRFEQAAICLREVLVEDPHDFSTRLMLAQLVPEEAYRFLLDGIEIDCNNIDVRNALIRHLIDRRQAAEAGKVADEAMRLGIANTQTRLLAIESAGICQDWSKAASLCDATLVDS